MVAKITTPKKIIAALNYNENKVKQGKAACLYAANFLQEVNALGFHQKLQGFERLNELNERATTKTLHISLNFDPSEKLSDEKLVAIASAYMRGIGFEKQPYLVYQHRDAGHPHIHLLTTTIQKDGSRINTHNIGRNQSTTARKEIEKLFGLVPAEKQKQPIKKIIVPVNPEQAVYGMKETKKSIETVVNAVVSTYKFTSLPELNAALKQFNIIADRGKEEGRIYKHRGLVYRILDEQGNKIGVPIKASSLNCRPTLDRLEKLYSINEKTREPLKHFLKAAIDHALLKQPSNHKVFQMLLAQKNIATILRQNEQGRIYGITFVDHQNKTVFNGSDLGKTYSAAQIQNRLFHTAEQEHAQPVLKSLDQHPNEYTSLQKIDTDLSKQHSFNTQEDLLHVLTSAETKQDTTPSQILKRKKKGKRKLLRS